MKKSFPCLIVAIFTAVLLTACSDDDTAGPVKDPKLAEVESHIETIRNIVTAYKANHQIFSVAYQSDVVTFTMRNGAVIRLEGDSKVLSPGMPLFGVVEKDGEFYWALFSDKGVYEELHDISGNKIAVEDLNFAVRLKDDSEWQISIDGKQTWTAVESRNLLKEGHSIPTNTPCRDVEGSFHYISLGCYDGVWDEFMLTSGYAVKFSFADKICYKSPQASTSEVYTVIGNYKGIVVKSSPGNMNISITDSHIGIGLQPQIEDYGKVVFEVTKMDDSKQDVNFYVYPNPMSTIKYNGVVTGAVINRKTDTKKGIIISIDERAAGWWSQSDPGTLTLSETSGAENMEIIKQQAGWQTKFPNFAWCDAKGEGWIIPSINELVYLGKELRAIVNDMDSFNLGLRQLGGDPISLNNEYWSSTCSPMPWAMINTTSLLFPSTGSWSSYASSHSTRAIRFF